MTKSKKPAISIIVACDENRGIGKNGKIPWHIPEDLKRFKKITMGHPVIMGRKTFKSIGKPLAGRTNIIITRDRKFKIPNCITVHSIKEAIDKAKKLDKEEVFIIGGAQIYKQAMVFADRLYLTKVKGNYDADTFFPDYSKFSKVINKAEKRDENYCFTFSELEKVNK